MESSSFPAQLSFITDLFSNTRLRQNFVATIVDKLQVRTGCQCVGIRIVNPDAYIPYEAYVGFSQGNVLSFTTFQRSCSIPDRCCVEYTRPRTAAEVRIGRTVCAAAANKR